MKERKQLRDIPNPDTRLEELEYRLANDDRRGVISALLDVVDDPYPPIRRRATEALAGRVDEPLANLFGALLLEEDEAAGRAVAQLGIEPPEHLGPTGPVKQAACRILAHTEGEGARDILGQAAADPDADVRYQALVALHNHEVPEDELERTVAARLQDADPEVASVAAQIVAEHGWTTYTEVITKKWRDARRDTRLQFAISLAELAGQHDADLPQANLDELLDELTDALRDERTVAGACRALVALGDKRAHEALESVVDGWFVHPLLRVEAAGALVELGDDAGRDALADYLDEDRDDVRGYALRQVGRLQLDAHFDRLADLAQSDDYHADTAILALAEWGSDEAMDILEDVADSQPDDDLAQLAKRALIQRRELGRFEPALFEFL